jgi:predicted enzyme related to lactoylglutathione lyase
MMSPGILKKIDAVTVHVPDIDEGLCFYSGVLGHSLKWRNDQIGQAGLQLAVGDSELVLSTEQSYEPNWLVESVDAAVEVFTANGGSVVVEPFGIPVGRVGVASDPFGNVLVLIELSGRYDTDEEGRVTGVS